MSPRALTATALEERMVNDLETVTCPDKQAARQNRSDFLKMHVRQTTPETNQ
jgi:hypothetical protein